MCPHACCRNKRVHPENFPVILPAELVRRASDRDLAYHYQHAPDDRSRAQVLREMDRRDRQLGERKRRKEASERRRFTRRLDRQQLIEAEINRAEAETRGELVNAAGRRAGISVQELFTGREDKAIRYASPELLDYWQTHPRPTASNLSDNPRVVRRARARSDIGRVEAPRRLYPY